MIDVKPIEFVCPVCKGPLERQPAAYYCARDERTFRITLDIPDFRVFADPYIGFDAEDEKTARIVAEYPTRTFAQLVEYYYSITPEVSPEFAQKRCATIRRVRNRGVSFSMLRA